MNFEQMNMFSPEFTKSLSKHQIENLKKRAEEVRIREKFIYEDYLCGLTIREISSKHHCVGSYVTAVVKYLEGGVDES